MRAAMIKAFCEPKEVLDGTNPVDSPHWAAHF
jgi:hypothetical protein